MLPAVARRSPPITTPPGNVTVTIAAPPGKVAWTIVGACGKCSAAAVPAGSSRFPGSMFGECADRNSVNDEGLWLAHAPGRRPGGEPCDVTRLLPVTAGRDSPPLTRPYCQGTIACMRHDPSPRPLTANPAEPAGCESGEETDQETT